MMENRSFDRALGALQAVVPDVDGVIAPDGLLRTNEANGHVHAQLPTSVRKVDPDPPHEAENTLRQLASNAGEPTMEGFASEYLRAHPGLPPGAVGEVMRYHEAGGLAALHELAQHFLICDRWFSSLPGPTWPNRLFAMSGTSQGRVLMPSGISDVFQRVHLYKQPSIFRRLKEAEVSYRVYAGDIPMALLLSDQRELSSLKTYSRLGRFFEDARGDADEFPAFSWIEPVYMGASANDDHPPHDVALGQRLIADVFNALRANEELWASTLLIINYDEHGGFYDHVAPPGATPPDGHREEDPQGEIFSRLGVRVPALLVSPRVNRGVSHQVFDHTSVLRYLKDKWRLGSLGDRVDSANSVGALLRSGAPRGDALASVVLPASRGAGAPPTARPLTTMSGHQRALAAFAYWLEAQQGAAGGEEGMRAARAAAAVAAPSDDPHGEAQRRVEGWLLARGGLS